MIAGTGDHFYIKTEAQRKGIEGCAIFFVFVYYVMPQYFGIDVKVFDLSLQRICVMAFVAYILCNRKRIQTFWEMILAFKLTPFFILYLIVCLYTAVFRTHVGTIMYPVMELLGVLVFAYIAKELISFERMQKLIVLFLWILCIEGLLEVVLKFSLFSKLETLSGIFAGNLERSGSYRVAGPCNHSIAYGMLLIAAVPIICIDIKEDEVDILKNPVLLVMVGVNALVTGSRSSLGLYIIEVFVLFCFSRKYNRKKALLVILAVLTLLAIAVVAAWGSSFSNYIMRQILTLVDTAMGTEFAADFGADALRLSQSSSYRKLLLRVFSIDALNPFVGRGTMTGFSWAFENWYIHSIDNYYVQCYIQYAYPGLVTACLIPISGWFYMIRTYIRTKSGVTIALFTGTVMFYINLWYVDHLMSLKYMYILFVCFFIYQADKIGTKKQENSKYIKW